MRFLVFWLGAILMVCCRAETLAQPSPVGPACGSGWNAWFVPDNIRMLQCSFGDACAAHDRCYGQCEGRTDGTCAYTKCMKGGELYSQPDVCRSDSALVFSERQARIRQSGCDADFGAKLREINKDKPVCIALANLYEKAVKRWGDAYFFGFDDPLVATPEALRQPQGQYEQALRDFLKNASEAQIEAFNRGQSTSSGVDLSRPIKYVEGEGLINVRP